ncbi:hypothetical protein KXW84_001924 [Aspergillus fumigatus]|nr:hypothetical protein KXW84_001924 [Aspergillus fumigatus]
MPDQPRRIILEKSKTVRRRYQRSNKRFQFTASQIERIQREEEREARAKRLREKEKKRQANKKKKAEKEAKAREARRRLGLPDPHALPIPSSQPLLSKFLKKPAAKPDTETETCEDTESDSHSQGSIATEIDESLLSDLDVAAFDGQTAAGASGPDNHPASIDEKGHVGRTQGDDDEFSECSIFYDEDIIKEVETIATAQVTTGRLGEIDQAMKESCKPALTVGESFQDDTAILLEEFGHEFASDEEFEQELIKLDTSQRIEKMPCLEVCGHSIHYADSHPNGAPKDGATIVFIHGLGSSQNYYFPILHHLTLKHRCITLDTYGSARSPYTGQAITISTIASDVIAVLDALHIPKAVVVGHSMGGLVVTLLGAQYSDRITTVVAVGPTHPSESLASTMRQRSDTVLEVGMEAMANTVPNAATGSQASPLAKAFIRELLLGQNPNGYATLCQAIAKAPAIDYSRITVPFLLIAGEEDKSASLEGCKYIFDRVSSKTKKMEVLPKVGHWHCIEAPDLVGGMIAGFIERV